MTDKLWVPPSARTEEKKVAEPGKKQGADVSIKKVELTPEQQVAVDKAQEIFGEDKDLLSAYISQPHILEVALEALKGPIGHLAQQCQMADRNNVFLNFKQNLENAIAKQEVIQGVHKLRKIDAFTANETIKVLAAIMSQLPPLNLAVEFKGTELAEGEQPAEESQPPSDPEPNTELA